MNRAEFVAGLAMLSLATVGKTPDDAVAEVYFDSIGNRVGGQEWLVFCRGAKERWTYWPSLAEILAALREFQGQSVEVEAGAVYEAVLNAGTWAPEGTFWDRRVIAAKCGQAAAIAFDAAGGHDAFVTTFAAERRREKFAAAYKTAVVSLALPPAPARPELVS
jgi:hypothetical protein